MSFHRRELSRLQHPYPLSHRNRSDRRADGKNRPRPNDPNIAHERRACLYVHQVLAQTQRIPEDLVNNLLHSSEERLARVLLSLANLGRSGEAEPVPRLSQQDLANMIGVTRQRVNVLLKRLRNQPRRRTDA